VSAPPAAYAVLPEGVDDPGAPSGGNTYDRRVCAGLGLRAVAVPGRWPHGDPAELARALAGLPDGGAVLLDGLVACAAPGAVEDAAGRLRLVVLVHLPLGDETGLDAAEADRLTALEHRTLHAAAAVVTTSEGAARRLAARHGLARGRVRVAVPGVEPAALAAATDSGTRLLCVAAVTPRKGQDLLVAALQRCADLPWECVCVGALDRAPEYARRLAGGRVRFAGPRTGAELDAAYAAADLFVLPSRAETYGMVVTEALARGVPVLATDVSGVPEALGRAPGGALPGLLVPPGDVDALAAALRRWLTDAGLRAALRRAARERRDTLPGWAATIRTVGEVMRG
jgi:glycosyltransferase involved in cell wall biosynthesis